MARPIASRAPVGRGALLNFDNTRRVLALDADEVQIGRRIYRSGESEYLINRIPAAAPKDIRDLFPGRPAPAATRVQASSNRAKRRPAPAGHQRRPAATSSKRRCGNRSRFKARKVDRAYRSSERVAQNLLRLTEHLVKEVESQLTQRCSKPGGQGSQVPLPEYNQELR